MLNFEKKVTFLIYLSYEKLISRTRTSTIRYIRSLHDNVHLFREPAVWP